MMSFLWGSTERRTIHTIPWTKICSPKSKGGLGLNPIQVVNEACLMKRSWAVVALKENLWISLIRKKYLLKAKSETREVAVVDPHKKQTVWQRGVQWCPDVRAHCCLCCPVCLSLRRCCFASV